MTKLIIVRHGHSIANDTHSFAGITDVPLSEAGKGQAEYVGEYLAANEHIDRIFISGLLRTAQTAHPTAERLGLPIEIEPDLREVFAGLWENLPYDKLTMRFTADWLGWKYDLPNACCTGGESAYALYRRVTGAIHRLCRENEGKTLMLVTHATPIRAINAMIRGGLSQMRRALIPTNASINIYRYENGTLTPEQTDLITYPFRLMRSVWQPQPPLMPKRS